MSPGSVDVLIVGGGVVGLSIAVELAQDPALSILVLDKGGPGAGTSGRSAGVICRHDHGPEYQRMSLAGHARMLQLAEDHGLGFQRWGHLTVVRGERAFPPPDRFADELANAPSGMYARELLGPSETFTRFPWLRSAEIAGSVFEPNIGFIDPLELIDLYRDLLAAAPRAAARFGTPVLGIERGPGGITKVLTRRGEVLPGLVVNATGAWGNKLAALAGTAVAVTPQRVNVAIATDVSSGQGIPLHGLAGVSWEGDGVWARGEAGGTTLFGQHRDLTDPSAPVADPDFFDTTADAGFADAVRPAVEAMYRIPGASVVRGWTCVYDTTPDGFPILGHDPVVGNLIHAVGMNGHGMTIHPGVARAVVALIRTGRADVDVSDVLPWPERLDFSTLPPLAVRRRRPPRHRARLSARPSHSHRTAPATAAPPRERRMTDTAIPRPEHPRPQLVRTDWVSLNGQWEFEIDQGDSGLERGLLERPLRSRITVPFAPESTLSGVGEVDFLEAVWYRRAIEVPADWRDRHVLLHFQAVDYDATVWVNGREAGRHRGGSSPFSFDITDALDDDGAAVVVVRARDFRHTVQPRGKQATWFGNTHCNYTRTTGIWQTVWMEAVSSAHILRPRVTPDLAGSRFHLEVPVRGAGRGDRLIVSLTDDAGLISEESVDLGHDLTPRVVLDVPADRRRLWAPGKPELYALRYRLVSSDGTTLDDVAGYAGLRSLAIQGQELSINGERVFQRLVLDQGYWPDGLMTAPSDDALRRDIELGLEAGFNGARLHQKVFEERYLYHADQLGYLVWGEFPDWGVSGNGPAGDNQQPTAAFIPEWLEVMERDHNHPSIVGWCPLNETHQVLHDRTTVLDDVTWGMFLASKAADSSRPVIDASGYSHRIPQTDVYDSHSYEQVPEELARQQAGLATGDPYVNLTKDGQTMSLPYAGQPYFVSEYGGIWWNAELAGADGTDRAESWGYGQRVASLEEFLTRFEGLTRVLLDDPRMFGYCYTQLTDVFQEQNGIYAFDRTPKVPLDRIRAVQSRRAAYEEADE